MTFNDTAPNAERKVKPLQALELEDLQAAALAIMGLLFDEAVPKTYDEKTNVIKFRLTEWLKTRGAEELAKTYQPLLSIPAFYVDPERVIAIRELVDIDDFPVLSPDDLTYTHPEWGIEAHHGRWQTCFMSVFLNPWAGAGRFDIAVHPRNQKGWAYTSRDTISLYSIAYDSNNRPYHFPSSTGIDDTVAVLTDYGRELEKN
jgi:hypothetical protein